MSRHSFDVHVSKEDLDDTYLYAFRKTLSPGGAYSVMCAYNRLDGSPACASDFLLKDKLRSGMEVSRLRGERLRRGRRHFSRPPIYGPRLAEASAKAVKAGTDLTCGNEYVSLVEAVQKRFITEEAIDQSVRRLFVARFRLGMFDAAAKVPYSNIGMDQVANESHREAGARSS